MEPYPTSKSGTIIACYLTTSGFTAQEAIDHIRKLRPGSIETEEQEAVIYEHALMGYGAKRETALYWKASAGKENVHVIYGD